MKEITLNHKQVYAFIKALGADRTIIVQGEMGTGKTAMQKEFMADPAFAKYHVLKPIECTQLSDGDLTMLDIDREAGVSRSLPNERFGVHKGNQKGINGAKPLLLCFDEVGKVPQRIVNMIAAPLYERRFGEYELPEGSIVYGCTNLSLESLGDLIPAHIRNRVVVINMRKPTQKEWVQDFAIPNRLSPEIIAATEMFPQVFDSFTDYAAGGKYAGRPIAKENAYIHNPADGGQEGCVTGRSLHAASDLVYAAQAAGLDDDTLQAGLDGAVGIPFGRQLTSFIRFGRDIPAFERVVNDPTGTPLSSNPTAQIVQVFQFITRATNTEHVSGVVTYVARMRSEMQALFINSVAQSSALGLYVKNAEFGAMLRDNRSMFSA